MSHGWNHVMVRMPEVTCFPDKFSNKTDASILSSPQQQFLLAVASVSPAQKALKMMCGGTSSVKEADAEIQQLCDSVRSHVEGKEGKTYSEFTAKHYKSQVVAGTNFFVKVHVGNQEFVHVRIFRPLPGQGDASCHDYQTGKTAEDEVVYF